MQLHYYTIIALMTGPFKQPHELSETLTGHCKQRQTMSSFIGRFLSTHNTLLLVYLNISYARKLI